MRKFYILLVTLLLILPVLHLQAQEVNLFWQGETYASPFYKGKALWSNQSRISFVAIPQGLGNSASLNYKWTRNGTVLGNINGIGRSTLSFLDSILSKSQIIKVEILSSQSTVLAETSITVTPISPILAVYENNPLYGYMFHKEVAGTYQLQ
ncbi:MAG: hypothetical protein Q8P21_01920, partial [bacterium]|nr:hypothetical protein [bacterium]